MNMKRTMAAVLSAAMLLSGGLAAVAADNTPASDTPAVSAGQTAPSMLSSKMQVTEVGLKSGEYSYIIAKEILPEGSKETAQEIRLNLGEETACIDSKTGVAANAEGIKKGDTIYATYSTSMTRSIPPQSFCYSLVVNLDEKAAPAHFLVAEQVTKNDDGSVTVLADNGSVFVTIGKDTPVSPYKTKNIVKNSDIEVGTNFYAWYDVVALSMPGQAHATRAVILPAEHAAVQALDAGEDVQPWVPGETSPYRFGNPATITDVSGDRVSAKIGDKDVLEFVTTNTLIIDDKTGEPASKDALKKDASIYVYYGPVMAASEPAQVTAEVILVNLDKDHAPARMLTAEQTEHNIDGSVRLLGDNNGVWVTIGKDTPITAYKTKNIVKNTDIRMGSTVLAWYDVVAESLPAQAAATKVVILPNVNSNFTIITGGDIAVAEGMVENGVAMVPLRKVAETLGFTVTWNEAEQSIGLTNGEIKTSVKLGEDLYYYATAKEDMVGMSKPSPLGAAAYENDGTSYVPAELFNLLGASVRLSGSVMYL